MPRNLLTVKRYLGGFKLAFKKGHYSLRIKNIANSLFDLILRIFQMTVCCIKFNFSLSFVILYISLLMFYMLGQFLNYIFSMYFVE